MMTANEALQNAIDAALQADAMYRHGVNEARTTSAALRAQAWATIADQLVYGTQALSYTAAGR